jgi:hypothetical protein
MLLQIYSVSYGLEVWQHAVFSQRSYRHTAEVMPVAVCDSFCFCSNMCLVFCPAVVECSDVLLLWAANQVNELLYSLGDAAMHRKAGRTIAWC